MGVSVIGAYTAICERFGVKFIYRPLEPHHVWTSLIILSLAPLEDRAAWFVERLEQIGEGTHFVLSHPAVSSPELRAITPQDAPNAEWAEPIRVADLDALCDPGRAQR